MRPIARLTDLPFAQTRAVIINCGTKWVASLALLSAIKHANCPVLLIDCESNDGSKEHFQRLAQEQQLQFDWLEWPLRPHPAALDALFGDRSDQLGAEQVLLLDSDVEIRSPRALRAMQDALAGDATAYGAGFRHGPMWMGAEHGLPERTGYYAERMWIPFVLLRSATIRAALAAGSSFATRRPFQEVAGHPTLSRLVGMRYRIAGLRRLALPAARKLPADPRADVVVIDGVRPAYIEYDTGADLHRTLVEGGHGFAAMTPELWGDLHHEHGVTRAALATGLPLLARRLHLAPAPNETAQSAVVRDIRARLTEVYGVRLAALGA